MKTKHVSLLLSLFVSVGFSACVDVDHSLGVDFVPSGMMDTIGVYETTEIPLYTVKPDSIITSGTNYALFGEMNYAPFGKVTAGGVFRVIPAAYETTFGTNPQLVSVRLRLAMSGNQATADQKGILQNIRVYRITKAMSDTLPYYNNSLKPSEYIQTPISQYGIVYNGEDTLSIPLTEAFGNDLLTFSSDDMSSDSSFFKKLRGFYIVTDPLPGSEEGGRINSCNLASYTYLELKYKHEEKDSTLYFYVKSGDSRFNQIQHDSWNTLVNAAPNPPADPVYMEGLAGVKPFIDFAQIKTQLDSWASANGKDLKNIAIANAQISFGVPMQETADLSTFPALVFLCYKYESKDNYITYSPLVDIQTGTSNGSLNRSRLEYSMQITHYMNRFLQGKDTTSKLYVMPIQAVKDQYSSTTYYYLDNLNYSRGFMRGTYNNDPKYVDPATGKQNPPVKFKMTYTFLK